VAENIVIVGGGFTGLTAAYALARRRDGHRITLIEAGPSLGGLAGGFPLCGTSLEKTYHYLLLGDTAIIGLARELGLEQELVFPTGSVGIHDGERLYPFTTALDLLRFRPCPPLDRVRLGLAMLRLQRVRNWQPLARVTAHQWLSRACGSGAMRAVWEPLLRGKFDRYAEEVAMAWLWARVHTRANSRRRGREKLGYFRGGFATLVRRMTDELESAGATLRTGRRVQRIEAQPRRELLLDNGEALAFDRCLFTGPSDVFSRLLPADPALDGYRQQLQSIAYLGAVCLILVTDQSLCRQHWVNIHDRNAPFLVMINHTALVGTALYQGRHVYYLGCYRPHEHRCFHQEEGELAGEWLDYLGRLFPAFDRTRIEQTHVFRFRNAQHVVDCDYERRIPDFRTPLAGVYLANFSQIFPHDRGTNFAVRDGLHLAGLVVEDAGRAGQP